MNRLETPVEHACRLLRVCSSWRFLSPAACPSKLAFEVAEKLRRVRANFCLPPGLCFNTPQPDKKVYGILRHRVRISPDRTGASIARRLAATWGGKSHRDFFHFCKSIRSRPILEVDKMTTPANIKKQPSVLRYSILAAAEHLFPGYFALVMATGVVSIACHLLGFTLFAQVLVGINWVAYAVLWVLTLLRLSLYRNQLMEDLSNHQRAPGFFTLVAGTCVLGTQNVLVANAHVVAEILWYIGVGLWFTVMYAFFTAVTVRERKPSLEAGINGAWLIAAVATQSIVVLRCAIDLQTTPPLEIQFFSLAMFMIGCMLYLAIIPLIFYRLTFIRLTTRDFGPPYWINMGAVAITSLAGSMLIMRAGQWPLLHDYVFFLKGFTLFFWSAATWWIPFLAALMVWRYLVRRDKLVYEPQFWGMVFPLGMYTTGTYQLSRALDLPFLVAIPKAVIFIAILAWLATFFGLLTHLGRIIRTNTMNRHHLE
ncbi:MAG: tellurite resistance/C4-dicarboxylate transporter family protein [Parvibaculum sp.]|nr:tellurite resistance/C4-dicarboxylate transporter family protein [Parvibaculum sp.]